MRVTLSAYISPSQQERGQTLPELERNGKMIIQPRYDYSTAKKLNEYGKIVSGFPLKNSRNHLELSRKCGDVNGLFVGFMDDCTPVRLRQDTCNRMSNQPDRIWFYLDNRIIKINLTKVFNGPADNRSFCAYDLASAKATCSWFAITKAVNGKYPVWANQFDIWSPVIVPALENDWYALCFAFVLAENRCVVTKFEANNPVAGVPEVFVDNPLCPANPASFWNTVLEGFVKDSGSALAKALVLKIKDLYRSWNMHYCKGQRLEKVGLHNEPYFRYFEYPDFLTPYSGLIQIRKYAENEQLTDLLTIFAEIRQLTAQVREELYRMLTEDFNYFA